MQLLERVRDEDSVGKDLALSMKRHRHKLGPSFFDGPNARIRSCMVEGCSYTWRSSWQMIGNRWMKKVTRSESRNSTKT